MENKNEVLNPILPVNQAITYSVNVIKQQDFGSRLEEIKNSHLQICSCIPYRH